MTQQFPEKQTNQDEVILKAENLTNEKVHEFPLNFIKEILGIGGPERSDRVVKTLLALIQAKKPSTEWRTCGDSFTEGWCAERNCFFFGRTGRIRTYSEQSILQNTILSILKKLSRIGFREYQRRKSVCKGNT